MADPLSVRPTPRESRRDATVFAVAAFAFRLLALWPRQMLDAYCVLLSRIIDRPLALPPDSTQRRA